MPKPLRKLNTRNTPSRAVTGSRVAKVVKVAGFLKGTSIIGKLRQFISKYIVLPEENLVLVMASWVVAAYLCDSWDRFPHLALTSPEKRCGKTRTLQILETIVPNPLNTSNISSAALYRIIAARRPTFPTLLLDEAQSMNRRGSEQSEVNREIFNASIDRNAVVYRCGGSNRDDLHEFPIYSPKVMALIGELDSVLRDRCLDIRLERKTSNQRTHPYRSRIVEPEGQLLREEVESWVEENRERIASIYDNLEPFPIENDRLAELLLPLQAVATVVDSNLLEVLEQYATSLDRDEQDRLSPGALLLQACKAIFNNRDFIPTENLISSLCEREDEPWARWNHGGIITAEALARLLKPYGIKPGKVQKKVLGKVKSTRGYYARDFQDAWDRYLPPSS